MKIFAVIFLAVIFILPSESFSIRQSGNNFHGNHVQGIHPNIPVHPVRIININYSLKNVKDLLRKNRIHYWTISSKHLQMDIGNIFVFDSSKKAEKIHSVFLKDNRTGKRYTWSFRNQNVVMVLDGKVKADLAHKYESILNSLRR
jgi:hypothetical protein